MQPANIRIRKRCVEICNNYKFKQRLNLPAFQLVLLSILLFILLDKYKKNINLCSGQQHGSSIILNYNQVTREGV